MRTFARLPVDLDFSANKRQNIHIPLYNWVYRRRHMCPSAMRSMTLEGQASGWPRGRMQNIDIKHVVQMECSVGNEVFTPLTRNGNSLKYVGSGTAMYL